MLKPGTFLQDRYEILDKIGSGGMSVVYKAQCHTLNRLVAIKVLKEEFAHDESFVDKFKMEAQAAARLSHPNIVNVYDVVDEDPYHYIVMELIEGITLKEYIDKKGHLESKEAIGVALQVAKGIDAAHQENIIHRDIKPQNMIISKDGKVKVADFGIARAVSTQTMNATAVGSVHYISPEQARGGYCDERSDIYSFGITLYEMVTGQVPFEGDNTVAVVMAHLEDPITKPSEFAPEILPALEQIILKCTKKRPDYRYSSMAEVITDLQKTLVNADYDIYAREDSQGEDELSRTRAISREELNSIQESRNPVRDLNGGDKSKPKAGEGSGKKAVTRESRKAPGRPGAGEGDADVNTQFDRIVMIIGIIAAILIVAVALFVVSRLTGLFRPGSGMDASSTVAISTEDATTSVDLSQISENQTYMPDVLGLPQDMAEAKLKENTLVMRVAASDYSDTYEEGQIMSQTILADTVVDKWSTVNVTVSKGSDKVDLTALNLLEMTAAEATELLENKGLVVVKKEENSDNVVKGNVIRYNPETAKVGDSVEITVSLGVRSVSGVVPNLLGQNQAAADALLAGSGFVTGDVTFEPSDTVEPGLVTNQSELPGAVLTPGTAISYIISESADETAADDDKYYIGSIDTTCSLNNYIGPAVQTSKVRVLIRLRQTIDGADIYTTLVSARLVVGGQTIPVSIPRIRGAYGVDSGTVEVVDADNLTVISSYPVTFFPAG